MIYALFKWVHWRLLSSARQYRYQYLLTIRVEMYRNDKAVITSKWHHNCVLVPWWWWWWRQHHHHHGTSFTWVPELYTDDVITLKRFPHYWCAILIAHQIVMAKHGGSCVHFSEISTCGRTSRETVSHPQCPPLPTLCKISLPIYVIMTNKLLQPLTTTWFG